MALALSPALSEGRSRGAHVALIVEDDLVMAETLKHLVASLGHEWMHAVTLEDVREAIALGGYCYVLLDMQIPSSPGAPPIVGCGETALRLLREKDSARNERGRHRLQIIVVTSYSREPEFVTRLLKMDANDFVAKPLASQQVVPDKIREALGAAQRTDHGQCATLAAAPGADAAAAGLGIDGTMTRGKCTWVAVHGERRKLQDSKFVSLARLVVAKEDAPGTWVSKRAMGIGHAPETASRINTALRGLLPKGEVVVESDKNGGLRLNPTVVVQTDWVTLETHAEVAVQKMARERRKR